MSKVSDGGAGEIGRAVVQSLEALARSGVTHLPKGRRGTVPSEAVAAERATPGAQRGPQVAAGVPAATSPTDVPILSRDERLTALDVIRLEVAGCGRCAELASTRNQTVFGVGNPQPRLVLMGEAPGADEDRQGEPFVGRAGQLLTKIIEACTFKREDVYILNTLKCRPPGNRNPLPEEAANCREFLDRQLAILRPEYICCLGTVAAQNLLATTETIGRLRGRFHQYQGIRVLCTYHPAYLLRNPDAKKDTWQDMQILLKAMGITIPGS